MATGKMGLAMSVLKLALILISTLGVMPLLTRPTHILAVGEMQLMKESQGRVPWDVKSMLYEDERLLAIDKPAGLATIAERQKEKGSVHQYLQEVCNRRLFIVHRLDKDVSGVLLFAKTAEAHRALCMAFEGRQVEKRYAALLLGRLDPAEQLVEAPIRQFGSGRMGVDPQGKPSSTRFVLQEHRSGLCLVYAFPLTGRRHQIRVHAYHLGHPIAGDPLYGDKQQQSRYPRLFLHACSIKFPEAVLGSAIAIEAPLPAAFSEI